jgi:hypothetical protein
MGGPKGQALHLLIESSILGEPPWFQHFFGMGESKWLIAKTKQK